MSNIDYSVFKGLREAKILRTERRILTEVIEVTVLSDVTVFEDAVNELWDLYNARWGVFHDGVGFPVSREELLAYCYTAVKCRVTRVRGDRFHIRCDDSWSLPTPIAAALAGLGIVILESPIVKIQPVWNDLLDDRILSYADWHAISMKLRAVERDHDAKILFARAVPADKTGDEVLANLIPVRDELGRVVEISSRFDFDPIAGFVYLLMGLYPSGAETYALPTHPLLMPNIYISASALKFFMHKYIESGVA